MEEFSAKSQADQVVEAITEVVKTCEANFYKEIPPMMCWKQNDVGAAPGGCKKGWTKQGIECMELCRKFHKGRPMRRIPIGGVCWEDCQAQGLNDRIGFMCSGFFHFK